MKIDCSYELSCALGMPPEMRAQEEYDQWCRDLQDMKLEDHLRPRMTDADMDSAIEALAKDAERMGK